MKLSGLVTPTVVDWVDAWKMFRDSSYLRISSLLDMVALIQADIIHFVNVIRMEGSLCVLYVCYRYVLGIALFETVVLDPTRPKSLPLPALTVQSVYQLRS